LEFLQDWAADGIIVRKVQLQWRIMDGTRKNDVSANPGSPSRMACPRTIHFTCPSWIDADLRVFQHLLELKDEGLEVTLISRGECDGEHLVEI
jgi:hypothetical protein